MHYGVLLTNLPAETLLDDPKARAEHWVREIRRRCACREGVIGACGFVEKDDSDVTVMIHGDVIRARGEQPPTVNTNPARQRT